LTCEIRRTRRTRMARTTRYTTVKMMTAAFVSAFKTKGLLEWQATMPPVMPRMSPIKLRRLG
jgi:hypothetical protein